MPGYDGYCPIVGVSGYVEAGDFVFANEYGQGEMLSVADSLALENPGFLILEIGAIEQDQTLSSAAGAVHGSLFSLFAACSPNVQYERIRTAVELTEVMKLSRGNWSHIVLIGHGAADGISFLDRRSVATGVELAGMLGCDDECRDVQILSLCCYSGCATTAQALSRAANVTEVIAPVGAFDLRWAVVFVTGYFLKLFSLGISVEDAALDAATWCGEFEVAVWRDGNRLKDAGC